LHLPWWTRVATASLRNSDEDIGVAIIVIVVYSNAYVVAGAGESRFVGHICEDAVSIVTE
jgi:hypothetical protein